MSFRKYIKTASFLLAVFSFSVLLGQEEPKTGAAKSIFEQYHNVEIFVGGSILFTTNQENSVDFEYLDLGAFNLGLTYNFYQTDNFNFKIGAIWRIYHIKSTQNLRKEDTGLPFDYGGKLIVGDFNQYLVPIIAEYFLPFTKKLNFVFGIGPEFTIYPKDWVIGGSFYVSKDGTRRGYTHFSNSKDGWLYIGVNASVGLNIETGPLLLQPTFTYHYQPETLFTNVVTTQNLLVSENTISTHEITGNYIMFGVGISLKRGLFRKKEHKEK